MLLQLTGLGLMVWAATHSSNERLPLFAKQVLIIAIVALAIIALQALPLPSAMWSRFGAREQLTRGYALLGLTGGWKPLSLTPYEGVSCYLALVPGLAIFTSMVRLGAYRAKSMAFALVTGALAGIMLGALQVGNSSPFSPWYLYSETNLGSAVGFFANANHMGTLLTIAFAFLASLAASAQALDRQKYAATLAICSAAGLTMLVGVVLNGSLAAYLLAPTVMAASAFVLLRPNRHMRIWGSIAIALLVAGSVFTLEVTPIGTQMLSHEAATSVESRHDILTTTSQALGDYFPLGSGIGSFADVYHLYESPERTTTTYVVHAHNDYLEIALEMGLPGAALMLAFMWCWSKAACRVWLDSGATPYARAGVIASAAILVHSIVDFPLRTAAISSAFAMCLALMANYRREIEREANELRPSRHVVIR
jgi:O-antigen ligase